MSSAFQIIIAAFVGSHCGAKESIDFISGVDPSRRPIARKVTAPPKLSSKSGLWGVEGEIPLSLQRTIESQGAWFTPLIVPGMSGPYDIRSFHSGEDIAKSEMYNKAVWDPIHFKPQIDKATDSQCLACHKSVLERKPRQQSQAGVDSSSVLAWYQNLDTYNGKQETFHWRHLESPYAKRVTQFKCTTCHQGNDPREKAMVPESENGIAAFTLRKTVNPQICLQCHGKFPDAQIMNLPGPWSQFRDSFQNNCLLCHSAIRTNRHHVDFLKPEAIEEAGRQSGDSCYGCHGGRAWYRVSYPYPRHKWPGMPDEVPAWAKDRPVESVRNVIEETILKGAEK